MSTHLRRAESFAHMMDDRFSILGIKFGLDPIIGLVPGAGSLLSLLFSGYLLWTGFQMGVPNHKLRFMVIVLVLEALVGSIPILGTITDFFVKANLICLRILQKHERDTPIRLVADE